MNEKLPKSGTYQRQVGKPFLRRAPSERPGSVQEPEMVSVMEGGVMFDV